MQENVLFGQWEPSQQSQEDEEGGIGTTSQVVTDFPKNPVGILEGV